MKTLIALLVAGLAAGSASAEDRVAINYKDADLTTVEGANRVYRHISNAAQMVCHRESVLGVYGFYVWRKCVDEAVERAVDSVDNSLLTARHRGEMPARLYSSRATTK